jgi:hypothetical protein
MYKGKKVLTKFATLFSILLLSLLCGCAKENKFKEKKFFYRAVNGKDTAFLSISLNQTHFTGMYEIRYGTLGKDSGDIRGKISGDTLIGLYNYKTYGGNNNIVPIALLRRGNKIMRGKGLEMSYMNIHYFSHDTPLDYDNSEFVFEEINKSEER